MTEYISTVLSSYYRRSVLGTSAGIVALCTGGLISELLDRFQDDDPELESTVTEQTVIIGRYTIQWQIDPVQGSYLTVSHPDHPSNPFWRTRPGERFVAAARVDLSVNESRGSYVIEEEVHTEYTNQTVDSFESTDDEAVLSGSLSNRSVVTPYEIRFRSTKEGHLRVICSGDPTSVSKIGLRYDTASSESFWGFGEQFSHLDMKGKRIPILSQEQGIGRGKPIVSEVADLFSDGASGDAFSTYAPMPYYMTDTNYTLFLENTECSIFDLEADAEASVVVYADRMEARLAAGSEPMELLEKYTAYAGRMDPLPDWAHQGAVVGAQGGTKKIWSIFRQLMDRDASLAAFWLQDWVGPRRTVAGDQLWWNWELDESHYPNWDELRSEFAASNISLLGYINPYLVDVSQKENTKRNLYNEARRNGYLIETEDGEPYTITITTFDAAIVDLSNNDARDWLRSVIQQQLVDNGFRGWMADFGEGMPFHGRLDDAEPSEYHNRYPVEWSRLNAEALETSAIDDGFFFNRSGFTRSPEYARLFWEGDQLVTWDEYDGFESAVLGLLTSGLSGIALNHSDSGGYTTMAKLGVGMKRSPELLKRWVETNTFTAMLRTHEGNQPAVNAQIYDSEDLLNHFARCSNIFAALQPYRTELMTRAAQRGYPVVRHPLLHYPNDQRAQELTDQFMLGSELMIAPILEPGRRERYIYLPTGQWTHLWSQKRYEGGGEVRVDAPIGETPVFYTNDATYAPDFVDILTEQGIL